MSSDTNQNSKQPENSLQPVIYGAQPNQSNDEVDLGELFSKLIDRWKLILGLTLGGTILAILLALSLPNVYQPSITISKPLPGKVVSLSNLKALLGGNGNGNGNGNELPSAPQAVFTNYFNLIRSDDVLTEFIYKNGFLEKLYPDSTKPESVLAAKLLKNMSVKIEEPAPEKKGGTIADPTRVSVSFDVENEAVGVDLLNGYFKHVNQKLMINLQNDVANTIQHRVELLSKQITQQREQHKQGRILTIQRMEQENAKKIALLKEKISAYRGKAGANRATRIANAKEALDMAKSLEITYPTTLEALAQRDQKGSSANTAITVLDKQSSSLYLQGSKYLTTLITTLENRKSDEKYLVEINNLREKIHLIKNDQELAALKMRKSDDPWIKDLSTKLAQISSLKILDTDFSSMAAYTLDRAAIISNKKIKPKRALIVVTGFVLSLFIAIFAVLIMASRYSVKNESN